ncbi:MAG: TIGR01620 family protein [Rhizobiales bacterium]|nr:TIGR01620 family protein [Hyphomicrobiales bacterium]
MSDGPRKPRAFVIDEPEAASKRKARALTGITFTAEEPSSEPVIVPPPPPQTSRRRRWGTLLLASLVSLLTLWGGLAITQLIEDLFVRSEVLGWIALGLAVLAGLSAVAIIAREIWSLARLSHITHIQADAARAINAGDAPSAARAIEGLTAIYGSRPDAQWGLGQLRQHEADIMEPGDRLRLAELYLVAPRDADAHRVVARAARRVTLITTVTPAAVLDILFVVAQNLRMLRELARLYGGRPSALATLRLARMVLGHLAVTGGLALSDNLIQHIVGKGLLGRLSARFGEGAVNGIMTARIGLAARDVCRPIPQAASAKETLGSLMRELVSFDPP